MKIMTFLLALAMIIASVFCPIKAYATQSKPWDCTVIVSFEGVKYAYTLSEHLDGISAQSLNSRATYCSIRLKKQRAEQLREQGYSCYEILCYLLPNFYKTLADIEKRVYRQPQDASVTLHLDKFTYVGEREGRFFDKEQFSAHLLDNLACFNQLSITPTPLSASVTKAQLIQRTTLRACYTTDFSWSSQQRKHNIALALSAFDGLRIGAGESVSFNKTVGERTQDRGYKQSKIIVDGKYVEGIGGGVCQASTAVYNAVLLACLEVNTRSRHTLISRYVEAGFDAMVSSSTDLVFTNNTPYDIYMSAIVSNGRATVKFYGCDKGVEVKRVSEVIEQSDPVEKVLIDTQGKYKDLVHYTDQYHVLEQGSAYVKSKAYLEIYDNGVLTMRKLLSVDTYKGTERVIVRGAVPRPSIVAPNVLQYGD